jgi:hypothetical protein
MNQLLKLLTDAIPQQVQNQAAANEQLAELVLIAKHLGLQDAASLIEISQKTGAGLPELRQCCGAL